MQSETATACFPSNEELKRCRSARNWCENCFFSSDSPRDLCDVLTLSAVSEISLGKIKLICNMPAWSVPAFGVVESQRDLFYLILSYLVCVCVLLAFWALLLQSHCLSPSSLVSFHHLFHLLSGWAVSGGVKWDVSINTTLICSDSGGSRQRWEPNSERDPGLTHRDRGENKGPDPYAELPHETASTSATSHPHPFYCGISLFSLCFFFLSSRVSTSAECEVSQS